MRERANLARHIPELDGVRGIAALSVLFYHVFYLEMYSFLNWQPVHAWTGLAFAVAQATKFGWAGVDLFFVLSGFLMTRILLETKTDPNLISQFYERRAVRLFPLYFAVLAILLLTGSSVSFVVGSAFFLVNFMPLTHTHMGYGIIWSISVEMQYYAVWPWIIGKFSRRGVLVAALTLCLLLPAARILIHAYVNPRYPASWLRWDGMGWGAMLGLLVTRTEGVSFAELRRYGSAAIAGAAAMLLPGFVCNPASGWVASLQFTGFQLLSVAILSFALFASCGQSANLFRARGLRYLGAISYGIYMIHGGVIRSWNILMPKFQPLIEQQSSDFAYVCLRALGVSAIVFVLAHLSFRYFEKPVATYFSKTKLSSGSQTKRPLMTTLKVASRHVYDSLASYYSYRKLSPPCQARTSSEQHPD